MTEILEAVNGVVFPVWFLIGAALVFFMQGGFAMVETGFTRAKNAGNIIMKNLMDFCIGTVVFMVIGFSLMMGENYLFGVIGVPDFQIFTDYANFPWSSFVFNLVFCATAATIVSGAMAERTKFSAYCIYSAIISLVIYPIEAGWVWNSQGWLFNLGYIDFAGSTAIHMVGGITAFIGAAILGPRIGKYVKDAKTGKKTSRAIPGHSITLGALGVFILWFGWYGFNPGSTLLAVDTIGHVAVTTTLGAAAGACAAMLFTWFKFGKPDLSMTLNGTLAGLVAITAPCASVSTGSAVIIGLIAGVLVVASCLFIEHTLKIDDPVGAISVHGVNGAFGTLSVGLFGEKAIDVKYWSDSTSIQDGLFMGGGFHQLGVQALGVISVFGFVMVVALILFFILKKTVGLRVSEEDEVAGLDLAEHGSEAYPDFMPVSGGHK